MDILPLYSSDTLEQSEFSDENPLNVESFGDSELDSLFKKNLNGLLRNKKLKKPRKEAKIKPIEEKVSFFLTNNI